MIKRNISVGCCFLALVALFCLKPNVCVAGREELLHDAGRRDIEAYWETLASPFMTEGLAVRFEPAGFPCFVREVLVFVDSTAEFRVHVLNYDEEELCEIATVAALEPASWVTYPIPSEVRVESEAFYVVAEIVNPPDPGIGTTYESAGGSTVYTKDWNSMDGIRHSGTGGNGGNAMIRALVDVPVQIKRISNTRARNDHIFISFDSPMDPSTLNAETIVVEYQQSGSIPGRYEYDDALRRVEFTPDSLFEHGVLTTEVSIAVADVYGNYLAAPVNRFDIVDDVVDESPPASPGDVSLEAHDTIMVTWEAVPMGDAVGYYLYSGPWAPGTTDQQWLANALKTDVGNVIEASIPVAQKELPFRVGISAYDAARNEGEMICDGCVAHRGSVLLVVESSGALNPIDDRHEELQDGLQSGAFDYNVWMESDRGGLPEQAYLGDFDLVFWTMGRRLVTLNAGIMKRLEHLMSSGGRLYYEAQYLLSRKVREEPFFPNWLHLTYPELNTDRDAPVVVGAPGDPVGDGVQLTYVTSGSSRKSYFEPQDDAIGFLNVMDKEDEICGLRYADIGDYGYRVVFSTAILSPVYNTEDRDKLMSRGLCWLVGKELDFRVAANTRVLEPYRVLELFVSANSLNVEVDVDAYLAVLVEADGGSVLLFYDGAGFVSEMTPFVSGAHLESGLFLPRTKVFEYLVRDELPSGKYTFFVALMQAGTQTLLTEPRSTVVFMK